MRTTTTVQTDSITTVKLMHFSIGRSNLRTNVLALVNLTCSRLYLFVHDGLTHFRLFCGGIICVGVLNWTVGTAKAKTTNQ